MRSLSTQSGPVHRIVFGTATLLVVASLLALVASRSSSRAVASPSDVGVSYVNYGEQSSPESDFANSSGEVSSDGVGRGTGVYCCVSSGGSCSMWAGSGCPSGSSPKKCPCNDDAV